MNEQMPNSLDPEDEKLAQKLSQVAEQTHANTQFAAELEERLRTSHRPRSFWLASSFKQISPALRWAALMLLLAVALSWSIRTLIPAPQPAVQNTPVMTETVTPTPNAPINQTATPIAPKTGDYTWRGTTLFLAAILPDTPAEANVFVVQPEKAITVEEVRALAERFGVQGEIIEEAEPEPNAPSAFSVVDGNKRLNVRSDLYFEFIPDDTLLESESGFTMSNPNAEAIIDEFMRSHNFDFQYTIEPSELYQGFYVRALTSDGIPLQHEFFSQNGLLFTLNGTQIISVSASLLKYDSLGTFGIKSAEEAFQQVIASTDFNGMIEGVHSSGPPPQIWKRDYPMDTTVTLYGWLSAVQSVETQNMLVSIDGFPSKGNLEGVENLGKITLVKATGQFTFENERKVFHVESWEVYKRDDHSFSGKDAFSGTLQKLGEDVVVVSEEGTFVMPDVPPEVPLPLENAYVYGVTIGEIFEWEGIEYAEPGTGGGGGGSNGAGFYKLNLNGPPAPFPTPTALTAVNQGITEYIVQENDTLATIASSFGIAVEAIKQANDLGADGLIVTGQKLVIPIPQTGQSIIGQRMEGVPGILIVSIYRKVDGSQRTEYGLHTMSSDDQFLMLEGTGLEELQAYHNLPVSIWGTVERTNQDGNLVVQVDRYEIPFPDLQIQLLEGKQRMAEVDGQQVVLFTTADGTTYAQMMTFNAPDTTILGVEGDGVVLEALVIPGETFGGYPTLHWFGGALSVNPKDNQITEMTITANQPYIYDETAELPGGEPAELLTATIERVELVYYIPSSRYVTLDESSDAQYIQPAWRFHGHYNDGNEFEILIQALKQEYLLPELVPFTRPG